MALNFCNNNSLSAITSLPASISGGGLNLISTQTASSSSAVSFTSGIDSTYKEYIFQIINCHPSANSYFAFNMSADGGSNYNVTKSSNFFYAIHYENDATTQVDYDENQDIHQGTGIAHLSAYSGTGNDESVSGYLHLFDPSNTTFVKHFISRIGGVTNNPAAMDNFTGGYANTTSAVNAVQFSFSSGNIDSGTIKLYGVS